MIGITFTLYDVFSYALPGFLTVCMLFFHDFWNVGSSIAQFYMQTDLLPFMIIALIVSYLIGQILSVISSLIIEKGICSKSKYYRDTWSFENILGDQLAKEAHNKFKQIVNVDYLPKQNLRYIICYVQENFPNVYSTAFIFLTFYGMARNIVLVGMLELIIQAVSMFNTYKPQKLLLFFCELVIILILFNGYVKFRTYFTSQIYHGFMLEEKRRFI
jgi:hypothetical protein